jgi:hypothetical protein
MWPWGHLALGYFAYSLWTRVQAGQAPGNPGVVILVVATQFPDLVDKPLAAWGVLSGGRALAHSVLFAAPICLGAGYLVHRRWGSTAAAAVVIGYATHLAGDGFPAVLRRDWSELSFLVWPLLPPPEYETVSVVGHLRRLLGRLGGLEWGSLLHWQSYFVLQFWLSVLVVVLWLYDGMPPVFPGDRTEEEPR